MREVTPVECHLKQSGLERPKVSRKWWKPRNSGSELPRRLKPAPPAEVRFTVGRSSLRTLSSIAPDPADRAKPQRRCAPVSSKRSLGSRSAVPPWTKLARQRACSTPEKFNSRTRSDPGLRRSRVCVAWGFEPQGSGPIFPPAPAGAMSSGDPVANVKQPECQPVLKRPTLCLRPAP